MGRLCQRFANLRKKLVITNVFTLIWFTLRWGKYLMMLPYERGVDRQFVVSRKHYVIYGIILLLANAVVATRSILKLGPEDRRNPYTLLGFSRLLSHVSYILIMTIIVCIKVPEWIRLMNAVVEWDTLLPLSRKLMTNLVTTVLLQFTYFFVRSALYVFFIVSSNENCDVSRYMEIVGICMTTVYCECFYIHLISNFAWMNVYLDAMNQELKDKLVHDDHHEGYKALWENPASIYNMVRGSGKDKAPNADNIRRLRFFYGKLMDIKDFISEHYSVQIFLTITSVFIDMVFFVFLIVTIFQYWEVIGSDPLLVNKFHQVAIITSSQITKLLLTVYLCEKIKSKGGVAAIIVHKSLHRVTNPDAKNELLIFSMELLHRSKSISAAGFFDVDFELLHTIIAAVTVYTIMIIQFQFPVTTNGENPVESLCKFV